MQRALMLAIPLALSISAQAQSTTANALPAKSALNAGVKWSVLTAVPPVPQSGVSLLGGAPPNDLCANAATGALDLGVPVTRAGNSTGATDDGGLGIPQVWEAFTTSECLDVTVDLCGTAPSFLNTFLQLYIDCPWTNVIDAASFNVSTCGDGNYTIIFPQLPAGTYYFPVISEFGSSGPYTITFSGEACGSTPPVNDDCPGAVELTPGTTCVPVTGNVLGATESIPGISCAGFTGTANDDLWYFFEATATTHTIEVTGSADYDAVVDLRSGACNGTSIACSDMAFAGGTEVLVATGLIIGEVYFVRVYDWFAGLPNTTTFDICVLEPGPPPANDICGGAEVLTPQATCVPVTGTTEGATTSLPAIDCNGNTGIANDDVWYVFTATAPDHTIELTGGTDFDAVIELLEGPCGSFTSLACSDATAEGGTELIEATGLVVGEDYFVRVYHFEALSPTDNSFGICVYDLAPSVPVNDSCTTVTPEPLMPGGFVTFNGTTAGATDNGDFLPGSVLDGEPPAVWHAIELSDCADLTVSFCGSATVFQSVFTVLTAGCPAGNDVVFADSFNFTDCGDGNATIYFTNVPAGTHYLPVLFDAVLANGDYELVVDAAACVVPVANDSCGNAQQLVVNAAGDCPGNAVAGDNSNAGDELAAPSCIAGLNGLQDVWYSFNTGLNDTVTVDLVAGSATDLGMAVYDACGGAELFCTDDTSAPIEVEVDPGTDLLIRVVSDPDLGTPGTFTICVSADAPQAVCDGSSVETDQGETFVTVCSDALADVIDFVSNTTSTESYAFILTDASDAIITQLAGNSLDFNTAAIGIYHVHGVSYNGSLTGVQPGSPIGGVGSDGDCAELSSNFVTVNVEICTGLQDLSAAGWSVYPNPTDGIVRIRRAGEAADVRVELLDVSGRLVLVERLHLASGAEHTMDLRGLVPAGSYVLRLNADGGLVQQRILFR